MNYYMNSYTWERILSLLLQIKGLHTKDIPTLHKFIEAVWFMARSGCQWRLLPKDYGNWHATA
jgi:transposase